MTTDKKARNLKPSPDLSAETEKKKTKKRNVRKMMLAHEIFSVPIAFRKP
jgi:hypothetical protein